jgi:hypothetical protein
MSSSVFIVQLLVVEALDIMFSRGFLFSLTLFVRKRNVTHYRRKDLCRDIQRTTGSIGIKALFLRKIGHLRGTQSYWRQPSPLLG